MLLSDTERLKHLADSHALNPSSLDDRLESRLILDKIKDDGPRR